MILDIRKDRPIWAVFIWLRGMVFFGRINQADSANHCCRYSFEDGKLPSGACADVDHLEHLLSCDQDGGRESGGDVGACVGLANSLIIGDFNARKSDEFLDRAFLYHT